MEPYLLGTTLDVIGKLMIGVAVLFVHRKIVREKKIDKKVLKEINHEKWLSIVGIVLIILGYLLHLRVA